MKINRRGFTLIELLITVAIIGILAVIAVPAYIGQQKNAARTEAFTNLQNLRLLEEQFMAEQGRYSPCDPATGYASPPPKFTLGTAGKDHPLNAYDPADANQRGLIQRGGAAANAIDTNNALTGFKPGNEQIFSYWIVNGQRISNANTNPPTTADLVAGDPPCFVAFAQGNTIGRVPDETFAIDCNNVKNF
jgi:prepilin-type N-terminal cleavage/methylation domain-containing protein